MQGIDRSIISDTILESAWLDWRKVREASVRITGLRDEIRTPSLRIESGSANHLATTSSCVSRKEFFESWQPWLWPSWIWKGANPDSALLHNTVQWPLIVDRATEVSLHLLIAFKQRVISPDCVTCCFRRKWVGTSPVRLAPNSISNPQFSTWFCPSYYITIFTLLTSTTVVLFFLWTIYLKPRILIFHVCPIVFEVMKLAHGCTSVSFQKDLYLCHVTR